MGGAPKVNDQSNMWLVNVRDLNSRGPTLRDLKFRDFDFRDSDFRDPDFLDLDDLRDCSHSVSVGAIRSGVNTRSATSYS